MKKTPWQKVLKKLQLLPDSERYLASGVYVNDGGKCGCAIGKLLPKRIRMELLKNDAKNSAGVNTEEKERRDVFIAMKRLRALLSKKYGLNRGQAEDLQRENDQFLAGEDETRQTRRSMKARYRYIVRWIKGEIRRDAADTD